MVVTELCLWEQPPAFPLLRASVRVLLRWWPWSEFKGIYSEAGYLALGKASVKLVAGAHLDALATSSNIHAV